MQFVRTRYGNLTWNSGCKMLQNSEFRCRILQFIAIHIVMQNVPKGTSKILFQQDETDSRAVIDKHRVCGYNENER